MLSAELSTLSEQILSNYSATVADQNGDLKSLYSEDAKLTLDSTRHQGAESIVTYLRKYNSSFTPISYTYLLVDPDHLLISGIAHSGSSKCAFTFAVEHKLKDGCSTLSITNQMMGRA